MALDEPNDEIKMYTSNEIEMMIEDTVLPYTENNLLDFINDDRGQGFTLGPVDGGCGCDDSSGCGDDKEGGCCC